MKYLLRVIAAVTTFLLAPPAEAAPCSGIECESIRHGVNTDLVSHTVSGGTLIITVTHRSGIGGAKVCWPKNCRPKKIIVKLNGFQNLEGLSAASGGARFQTSLKVAPTIWGQNKSNETEHELSARVSILRTAEGITVEIPKEAFAWKVNELQLGWVDAYRS